MPQQNTPFETDASPAEVTDNQAAISLANDADIGDITNQRILNEGASENTANSSLPNLEIVDTAQDFDFSPKSDTANGGRLFDSDSLQIENRNRLQQGQSQLDAFRMEGSQQENVQALESMRKVVLCNLMRMALQV